MGDDTAVESSSPHVQGNYVDDGPTWDPDVERAIRRGKAPFDLWVAAYYYSREQFNEVASSRARWKKYRDSSHEGGGLYGAFVAQEGEVLSSYYCDDVAAAIALTTTTRGPFHRVLRLRDQTLSIVANAPSGADSSPAAGFALNLLADCSNLATKVTDYLPRRLRSKFMDELYGLSADGLFLLDEASRQLARREIPAEHPEEGLLAKDAVRREAHLNEWFQTTARNASQFFYLRGVALGSLLVFGLAWLAGRFFPAPISRHDAALTLASGGIGALVSVLSRVRTSGLVLDYEVGPLRLFFLGAVRPLLGAIAGVLLLMAVIAGVIPLARPTGTSERAALYIISSFAAGFNERWFQDMLANVGERIQPLDPPVAKSIDEQEVEDVTTAVPSAPAASFAPPESIE